jgi:fructose-1,6-bisphosphatase/inositol monophosphatase family enzyme
VASTAYEVTVAARLAAAVQVVESVGSALLALRGRAVTGYESDRRQLKTPVDLAAEGWIAGFLHGLFPNDVFLAEEAFERAASNWQPPAAFWTIDALDGSRSFVEGFPGFCAQVAYVDRGRVTVAAIHEPVARTTYWASASQGAFSRSGAEQVKKLKLERRRQWPDHPSFVDSTPPRGSVGALMHRTGGQLIECGSIGVKICRVATGEADLFAKALSFALWDVAPGSLILEEAGGRLGLWNGDRVPFDTLKVYYENILAAPAGLFELAVDELQ